MKASDLAGKANEEYKESGDRPQTYSSPAIMERRRRILEETRKIIAEKGIAALSMNEIGQRAGVAKRTLYNAFQTRERMIASAIKPRNQKLGAAKPTQSDQKRLGALFYWHTCQARAWRPKTRRSNEFEPMVRNCLRSGSTDLLYVNEQFSAYRKQRRLTLNWQIPRSGSAS